MTREIYEYGRLIKRENRFIAKVMIEDREERVHVPNTGRLPQLLVEGARVQLRKSHDPNRKTKYSLTAAKKDGRWVNIDSQLPNRLAYEAIEKGIITPFADYDLLKREVTFGNSRFDLYYESGERQGFIEVKGVTLTDGELAVFPDAPTTRGTKHIYEMIKAVEAGYEGNLLFIVLREESKSFRPYGEIDQDFAQAMVEAQEQGVKILAYQVTYDETIPSLAREIPVFI